MKSIPYAVIARALIRAATVRERYRGIGGRSLTVVALKNTRNDGFTLKYCFANLANLRNKSFIYWPASLQRTLIFIIAFLIYLTLTQLFLSQQQQSYAHQIKELSQKLELQKNTIQKVTLQHVIPGDEILNRVQHMNLSNFMKHISSLANKNHIDLLSVKPLPLRDMEDKKFNFEIHPFQINITGSYDHLLQFMQQIKTLPDLAIANDFKFEPNQTINAIHLEVIVDLYRETII